MYNSGPSAEILERYILPSTNMCSTISNVLIPNLTNKYVYVKQDLVNSSHHQKTVIPKVLVNPHFKKKVFVNPNFNVNNVLPHTSVPKIHVNPNVQKLNLNSSKECTGVQKIHINPNVLRNVPVSLNSTKNYIEDTRMKGTTIKDISHTIVSTRTKFIRSPKMISSNNKPRKRRLSIKSKFKIIRSSVLVSPVDKSKRKRRASVLSKYKIVKSTCSKQNYEQVSKNRRPVINKFKLDNRNNKTSISSKNKKYVYVNRFLSISDLARNSLLKQNFKTKSGVLNTTGILYKKSPNSLKRISDNSKKTNMKKIQENSICKSKYKFIRKSLDRAKGNENNVTSVLKHLKVLRTPKIKKNVSPGKLRKCNIPCPYYRKFGRCKGKDNGKCFRKHDPDQIALCTKFLQGACIDKKCLLSHNVSPEKMPTCKFYLEGFCSRDDCPYLHVRINPKADICRDFLEGFCKKAAECDKRHQFLCPDYEKNGSCLKQRCPYPHGKMVRKYSVFNKNKFAKKSSDSKKEIKSNVKDKESGISGKNFTNPKSENVIANTEENIKTRYYVERSVLAEENCQEASSSEQKNSDNTACYDQETGIRFRPKLGKLPSFIAFEEV